MSKANMLKRSTVINLFEVTNMSLKDEINLELKTRDEPFNISLPLSFNEYMSNAAKPRQYEFDKTYDNYQIDKDFNIKYLRNGELLDLKQLEKDNETVPKSKLNFGSDVEISIDLDKDKSSDDSQEVESFYVSDEEDEKREIIYHTDVNDITNLLFEPYVNTENNPFLKLEENFEMTQELITQTLTTNQLPHHRKLTTMKSNVKDNENEEKLQINNAHQTPLQYLQFLENNLYQVNPDNSFELNALKKSIENKKIKLELFIEKSDEIESIIHDFTENDLNVQNVFCVDNEKKFFYLYSSNSKEINKLCIKKSSLLEMFNTTLIGESINCMDAFNGLFACGSSKGSVVVFQHSKKGNIEFVDKVQNERKISN